MVFCYLLHNHAPPLITNKPSTADSGQVSGIAAAKMRASVLVAFIILTAAVVHNHAQNDDTNYPIVTTANGQLRGARELSRDGRPFYKFLGIPYGKFSRFESSTPAASWGKLVLDATVPGPICYQKTFHSQEIAGEEDCLSVNVYTPILATQGSSAAKKLPVMLFVHGGGFWSGSGVMYNPNFFMDEDVVIVTVNYRLGPFGFFNLGIKEAPGNQGLKDVVLALKWVRDNIAVFNGDPGQVTIFGESAGGAIVSALLVSPMAQGLFVGVIAQSGPSTGAYFTNRRPKYYALVVAKKVGCAKSTETETERKRYKEIVECLRGQDKKVLLNALNPLQPDWDNEDEYAEPPYNFSVEDPIEGEETALPELLTTLVEKGQFAKVPVMLGVNKYETYQWVAAQFSVEKTRNLLNGAWNRVAPIPLLYYNYGEKQGGKNPKRDELSKKIRHFYLQDSFLWNDTPSIEKYDRVLSDRMENYPTRALAQTLSKKGTPTYLYMFDKRMSGKKISPTHAEELNYLFSIPPPDGVSPPIGATSPEYEFSKNFVKLWVSFAVYGGPAHTWGEESQEWTPLRPSAELKWYHLDDEGSGPRSEEEDFKARMEFWRKVEDGYAVQHKQGPTIKLDGISIKKKEEL